MDRETIASYEANAGEIFNRHISHGRDRMNQRILAWFHPAALTADIGSGSGIMLNWLLEQGYDTVGYEPVAALRQMSQEHYPAITVHNDGLPDLATIPDATYANVLSSAVLMHLPAESVEASLRAFVRITAPGGRLLISWRHGTDGAEREPDGRLFTPIEITEAADILQSAGATIHNQTVEEDISRPGVQWSILTATNSGNTKMP